MGLGPHHIGGGLLTVQADRLAGPPRRLVEFTVGQVQPRRLDQPFDLGRRRVHRFSSLASNEPNLSQPEICLMPGHPTLREASATGASGRGRGGPGGGPASRPSRPAGVRVGQSPGGSSSALGTSRS